MKKLLFMIGLVLASLLLPTGKAKAMMMGNTMDNMGMHRMVVTPNFISFADMQPMHIQKRIEQVNNSDVEGIVDLVQLPNQSGTHITVIGFGLQPNQQYVSLYYDNHVCNLEPYSVDDVIGGIYTANGVGVGVTQANQQDNLDDINSVSIRLASDFHLLACADIHP